MSQINYAAMSDEELRQYFLQHRQDKMALQAYLDRLNTRPRNVITTLDDPDFDVKVQAAIRQQMQGRNTQGESAV
ncbi:hypothetical protein OGM63_19940 [Plectonema radiosum NIES-515]|uniref:Uncharacterized protein n=1 Tax=Plectonema radiosum NIES-515 TaxID=2986073 RepID=A0ABT3B301_9CYAN|nr:hypothetical protein [Plectonema radiosum]MCV3215752.1 hypothetical protein [Plectonema radiosum NIES-515]